MMKKVEDVKSFTSEIMQISTIVFHLKNDKDRLLHTHSFLKSCRSLRTRFIKSTHTERGYRETTVKSSTSENDHVVEMKRLKT